MTRPSPGGCSTRSIRAPVARPDPDLRLRSGGTACDPGGRRTASRSPCAAALRGFAGRGAASRRRALRLRVGKAAGIAVDAIEDLIDQRLKTMFHARGHSVWPRMGAWESRNGGRTPPRRLRGPQPRVVDAQDPAGAAHSALRAWEDRSAACRGLRTSKSPTRKPFTARHQVGQVRRRGVARTEAREAGVLGVLTSSRPPTVRMRI